MPIARLDLAPCPACGRTCTRSAGLRSGLLVEMTQCPRHGRREQSAGGVAVPTTMMSLREMFDLLPSVFA